MDYNIDINDAVSAILDRASKFPSRLNSLRAIDPEAETCVSVGIAPKDTNAALLFEHVTISKLAALDASLDLEFFDHFEEGDEAPKPPNATIATQA